MYVCKLISGLLTQDPPKSSSPIVGMDLNTLILTNNRTGKRRRRYSSTSGVQTVTYQKNSGSLTVTITVDTENSTSISELPFRA